ncbi:MAG TPA: glycosyltransferase family 39 protein [Candidatus Acidoferrales bacterium]|nr:glycosyltransferase family 39 protein [Candidatus Acidoferrales bacterium]
MSDSEHASRATTGTHEHLHKAPLSLWLMAVILLTSCMGYFSHLGTLGLTGPDEPRYASIARNMVETGDWVTPRLNGQPWFEKPALYYWAAAASFRIFGENDYAARLPSGLAGLLASLAMAWAAWRFFSAATTVLVLLIMPTTLGIVVFSRAATPDMLFAGTLAAAMALGAELIVAEKPRELHRLGFGIFLGLAALAKGPAAVVLAGGSIVLWMLLTREWKRALRVVHPVSVAAFLVTAVPWYAACAVRNPDFLYTFFWLHNFERYLTPVFRHMEPWWFFVAIVLLALLPWTALLASAGKDAGEAMQRGDWADRPGLYFGCWVVFTVLFFSASKSKLPSYILPAVPPLVLVLANTAARMIRRRDGVARAVCVGLGATWLAPVASVGIWAARLPADTVLNNPAWWRPWLLVAGAGGVAIIALGSTRRVAGALLLQALLLAGMFEASNWEILPRLSVLLSSRAAAHVAIASGLPLGPIEAYRLQRGWQYGLEYYLRQTLPEWRANGAAGNLNDAKPAYLFTTSQGCGEITTGGSVCEVIQKTSPQAWLVRVRKSP